MAGGVTLTEDKIEAEVEALTDALDRRYLNGEMTPSYYEAERRAIARWADQMRRDGTTTTREAMR